MIEGVLIFVGGLVTLLVKTVVILTTMHYLLKIANKQLGIKTKDIIERLYEDPQALSDYFGRRLIAAAIVILGISIGALV
jgi:hypothetical protein